MTAQHRQMLDQVLALFAITSDVDLDLVRPGQDLTDLTARVPWLAVLDRQGDRLKLRVDGWRARQVRAFGPGSA